MHKPKCLVTVLHGLHETTVLLKVRISTDSKPSFMAKKVHVWSVFLQYVLVHKFSICFTIFHRICEQLSFMDVHAAFALNFVLMMQTCPSAVQVRPVVCLEASPI